MFGKENVINATIGSLYNEDEKLAVYDVVESVYRNLPPEDLYAYATNVIGEDDYLEEVIKTLLPSINAFNFSTFSLRSACSSINLSLNVLIIIYFNLLNITNSYITFILVNTNNCC